jgi:hypothetical protein
VATNWHEESYVKHKLTFIRIHASAAAHQPAASLETTSRRDVFMLGIIGLKKVTSSNTSTRSTSEVRLSWIDFARGFGISLVVCGHAIR